MKPTDTEVKKSTGKIECFLFLLKNVLHGSVLAEEQSTFKFFSPLPVCMLEPNIGYNEGIFVSDATSLKPDSTAYSSTT